jgi:glycosyltransferase involved in cell wall biosynthesis
VLTISLIVPTRGKSGLLRRTLASLEKQTLPPAEFEVVVVDDGSPDDTPAFLAGYTGPLRLKAVRHEESRGRASARNAGLRAAGGDLVVFLDDDMEVVPGFLAAHRALHEAGDDRVGVGNVVNAPEITDSPIARYMSSRGAQKIRGRGPLPWKYFSTNNSSVRLVHLREAGFFDEEFVTYGFEDLELGYRLSRTAGLKFLFVEEARSLHIHYHDLDDVLEKKYVSGRSSLAILFRKHPETRRLLRFDRYQPPRFADPPGLLARRLFYRALLKPPVYRLLKPLARFGRGWLSDRVLDYLVLYQTLRGLAEAEAGRSS